MAYKVKELYYSFQGEGVHTGRPAIFCRFSGCNLWSGREEDRHKAICQFCDTDFWGIDGENGGKYDADSLAAMARSCWPKEKKHKYVIFTGGEPALQLNDALITAFKNEGFTIAIETNGTLALPSGIDWICVSPKANTEVVINKGQELKLVHPQNGLEPKSFEHLEFENFSLQPMDNKDQVLNTEQVISYCLANPRWHISFQTHKYVGAK